jgi:hypothetical protein
MKELITLLMLYTKIRIENLNNKNKKLKSKSN